MVDSQPLSMLTLGLIFDKTEVLHSAFDAAKPKQTIKLENAHKILLNGTPTHVRFSGDERSLIVALREEGVLILDCDRLRHKVPFFPFPY